VNLQRTDRSLDSKQMHSLSKVMRGHLFGTHTCIKRGDKSACVRTGHKKP